MKTVAGTRWYIQYIVSEAFHSMSYPVVAKKYGVYECPLSREASYTVSSNSSSSRMASVSAMFLIRRIQRVDNLADIMIQCTFLFHSFSGMARTISLWLFVTSVFIVPCSSGKPPSSCTTFNMLARASDKWHRFVAYTSRLSYFSEALYTNI